MEHTDQFGRDAIDARLRDIANMEHDDTDDSRLCRKCAAAWTVYLLGRALGGEPNDLDQAPVEPTVAMSKVGPETWQAGATNPPSDQAPVEPPRDDSGLPRAEREGVSGSSARPTSRQEEVK